MFKERTRLILQRCANDEVVRAFSKEKVLERANEEANDLWVRGYKIMSIGGVEESRHSSFSQDGSLFRCKYVGRKAVKRFPQPILNKSL